MHPFALTPRAEGSPPADGGGQSGGPGPLPLPPYESDIHCVSVIGQIEASISCPNSSPRNSATRSGASSFCCTPSAATSKPAWPSPR